MYRRDNTKETVRKTVTYGILIQGTRIVLHSGRSNGYFQVKLLGFITLTL
jgi:uncharacterized RDD family membrane protein YckC